MTSRALRRLEELALHPMPHDELVVAIEDSADLVMVAVGRAIVYANPKMKTMVGADLNGHEWRPYINCGAGCPPGHYEGRIATTQVLWTSFGPSAAGYIIMFGHVIGG